MSVYNYIFLYFKTILQIDIFSQQGLKQISRDLVVTPKGIFLIGREKQEPKQKGGKAIEAEVVTRKIEFKDLHQVSFKYVHNDLFQNIIDSFHKMLLNISNFPLGFLVYQARRFRYLSCD